MQVIWIISHLLHLFCFPGGNVNRGKARRTSCCETFPLFTACYTTHSSHSIKPAVLMCYGSKLATNSTIGNLNILNVYHIIRKCPPSLSVRNEEIKSFEILNCPSVAMNQSNILLWRGSMCMDTGEIRKGLNYTPHPCCDQPTIPHLITPVQGFFLYICTEPLKRARIGHQTLIVFQIIYTNSHKFHQSDFFPQQ